MKHLPDADSLVAPLARAAGDQLTAVLGFGSRVTGASPDARSAWDLFVVVEDYRTFYERIAPAYGWRRSAASFARLNRRLPPNVTHLVDPDGPGAKLFIISEEDLARRLAPGAVDHFCRARLMQHVETLHVRDEETRKRLDARLSTLRHTIVGWLRPFLPEEFSAEDFCRRLLQVSYRTEVRPESGDRAGEVFSVQRASLLALYEPILEEAAETGVLVRRGDAYAVAEPVGWLGRRGAGIRLVASKILATLRWPKYLLTFEGWLDYIAAKAERRIGVPVELTDRERRWPLLFLWPKFFRIMRARHQTTGDTAR